MSSILTTLVSLFVTPIVVYVAVVIALGLPLLRSARWDVAFQRTAMAELDRRGLWYDTWDVDEFTSVSSIVGPKELDEVEDGIAADYLASVAAIADNPDITEDYLLAMRRMMFEG